MNGGAFGVRLLGTAVVVNSIIRDFPDNRAIPQSAVAGPKPWSEVQRQTRIKQGTTKAVPSNRTPKAVASLWLLHLFLKDHQPTGRSVAIPAPLGGLREAELVVETNGRCFQGYPTLTGNPRMTSIALLNPSGVI